MNVAIPNKEKRNPTVDEQDDDDAPEFPVVVCPTMHASTAKDKWLTAGLKT